MCHCNKNKSNWFFYCVVFMCGFCFGLQEYCTMFQFHFMIASFIFVFHSFFCFTLIHTHTHADTYIQNIFLLNTSIARCDCYSLKIYLYYILYNTVWLWSKSSYRFNWSVSFHIILVLKFILFRLFLSLLFLFFFCCFWFRFIIRWCLTGARLLN